MIVQALATWRLTTLVTEDEVTRPAREYVARRWPGSRAAYLVTCRRCVSVWAALVLGLAPKPICRVLAASALSILLDNALDQQAARATQARMADARAARRQGQAS